jgi:hypothetical protein
LPPLWAGFTGQAEIQHAGESLHAMLRSKNTDLQIKSRIAHGGREFD